MPAEVLNTALMYVFGICMQNGDLTEEDLADVALASNSELYDYILTYGGLSVTSVTNYALHWFTNIQYHRGRGVAGGGKRSKRRRSKRKGSKKKRSKKRRSRKY